MFVHIKSQQFTCKLLEQTKTHNAMKKGLTLLMAVLFLAATGLCAQEQAVKNAKSATKKEIKKEAKKDAKKTTTVVNEEKTKVKEGVSKTDAKVGKGVKKGQDKVSKKTEQVNNKKDDAVNKTKAAGQKINKESKALPTTKHLKKDGTPDKRYKENK